MTHELMATSWPSVARQAVNWKNVAERYAAAK